MKTRKPLLFTLVAFVFGAGFILGSSAQGADVLHAQSANRVFELRIYTAPEGKLDNLRARFRDHTMRVFERHGMTNIGYWTPRTRLTRWSTSSLTTAARPRRRAGRPLEAIPIGSRYAVNLRRTAGS